jgi:hypothetical protein
MIVASHAMTGQVEIRKSFARSAKLPAFVLVGAVLFSAGGTTREALADDGFLPHTTAEWLSPHGAAQRLDSPTSSPPLEIGPERRPIVFVDRPTLLQASESSSPGGTGLRAQAPVAWGEQKSYLIPALEILGFQVGLNLADRVIYGCCDFHSDFNSIAKNLHRRGWTTDADTFTVNQLGHPYQGSIYYGLARSAGLNFWEGFGYAFLASGVWEIAGETTPPSRNDQITTPIGGTFLGEALFRIANLWLEQGAGPPLFREVAAAVVSPPTAFNRLAFGERFRGIYPSGNPEYYSRLAFGVSSVTQNDPGTPRKEHRTEGIVDAAIDYGLPGRDGYQYRRPFDYFSFQVTGSTGVGFESVMTRGLLFGTDYGSGAARYRGIWGLYGSYDYIAPNIFRLASSALSLGTTLEWRATKAVTFQGTALAGAGYSSVSTINGAENEHSNHYGVTPTAALVLRAIFSERASLDLSAREYFVSNVSGGSRGGHDNVVRADATLTWRVTGRHGIALKYQYSRRDAEFAGVDRSQERGTIGIFYTLLGRERFGTGDWK